MSKPIIEIIEASWHRNGVGGQGFYSILFEDKEEGRMVASLFDEPGYCAVYQVDQLASGNIAFARGNSWRGDVYEDVLRPALKQYQKKEKTGRIGPFSAIPAEAVEEVLTEHLAKRNRRHHP